MHPGPARAYSEIVAAQWVIRRRGESDETGRPLPAFLGGHALPRRP
jgi:hypothetical protein